MFTFISFSAGAQMKMGGGPFLRSDAILELGSGRKGLLLPRVNNAAMAASPLDTAAAGMFVFSTNDQSLYIKKSNGSTPWTRIIDEENLSMNSLEDINISSAQNDQLLRYQAGKWSNWTPNYITSSQALNFSGGDVEGNSPLSGNIGLNLKNTVTAGSGPRTTYNSRGLVTGSGALLPADIVAGSDNYIQNQVAAPQATAGFNIAGAGTLKALKVNDMAVEGGMLFTTAGTLTQDAAQLVWDNTGNELGIGTNDPQAKLDVRGSVKLGTAGTPLNNIIKGSIIVNVTGSFTYTATKIFKTNLTGIALNMADNIILNPRKDLGTGLGIGWVRVTNTATSEITIGFTNTGNANTIGNVTLDYTIIQ